MLMWWLLIKRRCSRLRRLSKCRRSSQLLTLTMSRARKLGRLEKIESSVMASLSDTDAGLRRLHSMRERRRSLSNEAIWSIANVVFKMLRYSRSTSELKFSIF